MIDFLGTHSPLAIQSMLVMACIVLPILCGGACWLIRRSNISEPPYFAYVCIFASFGTVCLSLSLGNTPLVVAAFVVSFLLAPLILIRNLRRLRAGSAATVFHRAAIWATYAYFAVILSLLVVFVVLERSANMIVRTAKWERTCALYFPGAIQSKKQSMPPVFSFTLLRSSVAIVVGP